ncbi:hypothetical protein BMS3Abin03_00530 [bacterium BMS3Abin03]|nr:hypothetical protein BMS3Abin03_00530 [bacterium BMS3Abin03]
MIKILGGMVLFIILAACSSKTIVRERTVEDNTKGGQDITTLKIDDEVISNLKTTWKKEYITAFGQVPVVDKYPDESRNKMLARKGAILDAERNLAEKISTIKITATTTMADFSTSDFVQSRIETVLKDVEILTERYDEKNNFYEVQVQMPKVKLINILEEYNNM